MMNSKPNAKLTLLSQTPTIRFPPLALENATNSALKLSLPRDSVQGFAQSY